jgi:restriction endonuclease S subunit
MEHTTMIVRLGDLCSITPGFSPYGRSPAGRGEARIRMIGTKDVRDGTVDLADLDQVIVDDAEKLAAYRVMPGDILVVIRGAAFRSAVCDADDDDMVAGGNLAIIRLGASAPIGPYLLQSILASRAGDIALRGLAQGSGTLAIRPSMLAAIEIEVPPQEEAHRLEDLCRNLSRLRTATLETLRTRTNIVGDIVGRYVRAS